MGPAAVGRLVIFVKLQLTYYVFGCTKTCLAYETVWQCGHWSDGTQHRLTTSALKVRGTKSSFRREGGKGRKEKTQPGALLLDVTEIVSDTRPYTAMREMTKVERTEQRE